MALLETVRAEREAKIARLKEAGMDPYPARTARTHSVDQFLENHGTLEKNSEQVMLAGRVLSIREHGGSLFIDIFDGTKGQCFVQREKLGADSYLYLDIGNADPMIIRQNGTTGFNSGDVLYAVPEAGKLHRFNADGRPIA